MVERSTGFGGQLLSNVAELYRSKLIQQGLKPNTSQRFHDLKAQYGMGPAALDHDRMIRGAVTRLFPGLQNAPEPVQTIGYTALLAWDLGAAIGVLSGITPHLLGIIGASDPMDGGHGFWL